MYFPGVVFFLVLIAGLAGVIRGWRRWGGLPALPWAIAVTSIVTPALLTQSLYRYTIVAIPLACLAAGLGFARRAPGPPRPAGPARPAVSRAQSRPSRSRVPLPTRPSPARIRTFSLRKPGLS